MNTYPLDDWRVFDVLMLVLFVAAGVVFAAARRLYAWWLARREPKSWGRGY